MSGFAFGPEKFGLCKRHFCPCNKRQPETVAHTFHECARSRRLMELVLRQWRDVTGEVKLRADDARVCLFGDRSGTWATEAEQGEWAGLDEPFLVSHHVAMHTIYEERNRDAAPNPRPRRSAAQLYDTVAHTAQRVVAMRWREAVRAGNDAKARFRKRWEAPGLAVVAEDESEATLVLFMPCISSLESSRRDSPASTRGAIG